MRHTGWGRHDGCTLRHELPLALFCARFGALLQPEQ